MSTRPVRPADSRRRQLQAERRRYGLHVWRPSTVAFALPRPPADIALRVTFGPDGEPTGLTRLNPDSPRPAA